MCSPEADQPEAGLVEHETEVDVEVARDEEDERVGETAEDEAARDVTEREEQPEREAEVWRAEVADADMSDGGATLDPDSMNQSEGTIVEHHEGDEPVGDVMATSAGSSPAEVVAAIVATGICGRTAALEYKPDSVVHPRRLTDYCSLCWHLKRLHTRRRAFDHQHPRPRRQVHDEKARQLDAAIEELEYHKACAARQCAALDLRPPASALVNFALFSWAVPVLGHWNGTVKGSAPVCEFFDRTEPYVEHTASSGSIPASPAPSWCDEAPRFPWLARAASPSGPLPPNRTRRIGLCNANVESYYRYPLSDTEDSGSEGGSWMSIPSIPSSLVPPDSVFDSDSESGSSSSSVSMPSSSEGTGWSMLDAWNAQLEALEGGLVRVLEGEWNDERQRSREAGSLMGMQRAWIQRLMDQKPPGWGGWVRRLSRLRVEVEESYELRGN